MMRRQRNQKASKRNASRAQAANMSISHPPQVRQLNLTHGVRMRFVATAGTGLTNITFQNLLDTWLVATSATALYDLFIGVKIRAVEVWGQTILGAASTVAVQFLGNTAGQFGEPQYFSDTSMGVQPAHVKAVPAAKSLLSFWQQSSTDVAFQITCPAGAVIDLDLSFVSRFGAPLAAQNIGAGLSIGTLYIRGFDGLAASTTNFVPVTDVTA